MTVAELLTASRAAHEAYRQQHTEVAKLKRKLQPSAALQELLAHALADRAQAHTLDPNHVDPAWVEDRAKHDDLLAFYRQQLGMAQ